MLYYSTATTTIILKHSDITTRQTPGGLYECAVDLLGRAAGSFGLTLSHSLDAGGEVAICARGQPMSVAFYPSLGAVVVK
jgi:hypothetical protein